MAYGHISQLPLLAALVAISDDPILKTAWSLLRCEGKYTSLRGLGVKLLRPETHSTHAMFHPIAKYRDSQC